MREHTHRLPASGAAVLIAPLATDGLEIGRDSLLAVINRPPLAIGLYGDPRTLLSASRIEYCDMREAQTMCFRLPYALTLALTHRRCTKYAGEGQISTVRCWTLTQCAPLPSSSTDVDISEWHTIEIAAGGRPHARPSLAHRDLHRSDGLVEENVEQSRLLSRGLVPERGGRAGVDRV